MERSNDSFWRYKTCFFSKLLLCFSISSACCFFGEVELCSSCISFDGFLVLFIVSFSNSIGISLGIYFARGFGEDFFSKNNASISWSV